MPPEDFSSEIGLWWRIDLEDGELLRDIEVLDAAGKAKLTTALVDRAEPGAFAREDGGPAVEITREVFEEAKRARRMPMKVRLRRLLERFGQQTGGDCGESIQPGTDGTSLRQWRAVSESKSTGEVWRLIEHLAKKGLLVKHNSSMWLSVEGAEALEEARQDQDQVFVAMWFDNRAGGVRTAIEEGIRDAGFRPYFDDENKSNGQLGDEIRIEIDRSRALVGDLGAAAAYGKNAPDGNHAARPNVYYEIGFAAGRGKAVFITAPKGSKPGADIAAQRRIVYDPGRIAEGVEAERLRRELGLSLIHILGEGPYGRRETL